ncbi:hypothetical protein CRG98_004062 [Punica granatum]|uniref:Uncharacterized protein n=1 Tax=Punica granatum TaxID=22663 RepID=A0A2I0L5X8_PUNGR|nr:hypothetical protein CRG98_004062 [Punica granatum]
MGGIYPGTILIDGSDAGTILPSDYCPIEAKSGSNSNSLGFTIHNVLITGMIRLFLSPADEAGGGDDESARSVIAHLNQLGSVIWSAVVAAGCRSEARLWLCNTISRLTSLPRLDHRDIFVSLLRSKPRGRALASQLLQMMFEKRPHMAGPVIARRSHLLEQFFRGNPRRIFDWFWNFDAGGGLDHKKGAKALSQFTFINRDICWEELEWKGKHGQSPAMVATKPHYFLDLDVQRTVENFAEYVPEFWSSSEFAESLRDGEILSIDSKYFLELFVDFMYVEDARDVWEVVSDFLMEEPFSCLCQRLLIGLEESDFLVFLKLLGDHLRPKMEHKEFGHSTHWLEIVLSKSRDFTSVDQLLLLNAVISQGRQLVRVIHDEECREEKEKIGDILSKISNAFSGANSFVSFLEECQRMKTVETDRAESWLLSTDEFTASWTIADLPEHIANQCFSAWMKWVNAKLTGLSTISRSRWTERKPTSRLLRLLGVTRSLWMSDWYIKQVLEGTYTSSPKLLPPHSKLFLTDHSSLLTPPTGVVKIICEYCRNQQRMLADLLNIPDIIWQWSLRGRCTGRVAAMTTEWRADCGYDCIGTLSIMHH